MAMSRKRLFGIIVCGTLGVAVLFFLLNPYTRQSVFGPKIQGEPLCCWQDRFAAAPGPSKQSAMSKVFTFLGITSQSGETLWLLNHQDTIVVALSLLDDPRPTVRADMAQILSRYPESPDAAEGLLRLLDDPHPMVRVAAVRACGDGSFNTAPVLLKLHELMEDQDLPCRVSAASLLVTIGGARDKKTLTVLLEGLGARDEFVRVQAARSLCQLAKDYPECFTDVAAAARRDLYVRLGFARAGYAYGPVAIPLLIELLDDSNVGDAAARSLGNMGPTAASAIPALVRVHNNAPGTNGRGWAYEALSKIDPERYPQKKADKQ
jgi:HEAT repeat protein